MHEAISIQVGQCGNQIGNEFWKKISIEHAISTDGILLEHQSDRKDTFFYQADDSRYIPRAILVDLEPRVVASSPNIFNFENIFVTTEGTGAGNNWAHGYYEANKSKHDILEIIQREAEGCDSLETFNLMHSVAGGTGSGFGSLLIQELRDQFPKQIISSYSILPTNEDGSDVVVQPYNTILSLSYLDKFCDSIIVMDNHALGKVSMDSSRSRTPSLLYINSLVATVISASNSSIRFPGHMYCDNKSVLSCTVPYSNYKFLIPSYAPFICDEMSKVVRTTTVGEVLRRLNLPKNKLCTFDHSVTHTNLSVFNVLDGVRDPSEVSRSLELIFSKKSYNFSDKIPPFFQTVISKRNTEFNRVTGLSLNNSSGIANLLKKNCYQYDQLKKRNAFVEIYKKYDTDLSQFDYSRGSVQKIIEEYEGCQQGLFIS